MLIRIFRSIRNKPKEVRDQYAFWIAVIVTGLVAAPWVVGIPGQLATGQENVDSEPIFSSLFDEAAGRLSEVTDSLDGLRNSDEQDVVSDASTTTSEIDMSFIDIPTTTPAISTDSPESQREVRIATTTASTTQ